MSGLIVLLVLIQPIFVNKKTLTSLIPFRVRGQFNNYAFFKDSSPFNNESHRYDSGIL